MIFPILVPCDHCILGLIKRPGVARAVLQTASLCYVIYVMYFVSATGQGVIRLKTGAYKIQAFG